MATTARSTQGHANNKDRDTRFSDRIPKPKPKKAPSRTRLEKKASVYTFASIQRMNASSRNIRSALTSAICALVRVSDSPTM
jgi:hypothetical protein